MSTTLAVNSKNILIQGLEICLDKLLSMKSDEDIKEYLFFGSEEINIKEEIARLLLIATTLPKSISPVDDISNNLMENTITDIDSKFIKEFLSIEERNKKTSFMKSSLYKDIINNLERIENQNNKNSNFNDSIVLMKNIRQLYLNNIDTNISNNVIDVRLREPLIELFQHNLDITQNKIKEKEIRNV